MRAVGRPKKLTPDLIERLLETIAGGLSRSRAASLCGVSLDTISRLCKKDSEFQAMLEKAEIAFEQKHIANIEAIATGQAKGIWQASAWLLARKFPAQYSENATHQEDQKAQVGLNIVPMPVDYRKAIAQLKPSDDDE